MCCTEFKRLEMIGFLSRAALLTAHLFERRLVAQHYSRPFVVSVCHATTDFLEADFWLALPRFSRTKDLTCGWLVIRPRLPVRGEGLIFEGI